MIVRATLIHRRLTKWHLNWFTSNRWSDRAWFFWFTGNNCRKKVIRWDKQFLWCAIPAMVNEQFLEISQLVHMTSPHISWPHFYRVFERVKALQHFSWNLCLSTLIVLYYHFPNCLELTQTTAIAVFSFLLGLMFQHYPLGVQSEKVESGVHLPSDEQSTGCLWSSGMWAGMSWGNWQGNDSRDGWLLLMLS